MPFSVLYFAFKGHKVWLEPSARANDSSTPSDSTPQARRKLLSAGGIAPLPSDSPASSNPQPRRSASLGFGFPTSGQASQRLVAPQQRHSMPGNQQYGRVLGKQRLGVLHSVQRLLLRCITPVVAAALGMVAYAVLLVVLVLVLLQVVLTECVRTPWLLLWGHGAAPAPN